MEELDTDDYGSVRGCVAIYDDFGRLVREVTPHVMIVGFCIMAE